MSTAAVTATTPKAYFCYQCNRTVTLTPLPNSDLSCPNCNGGFLEEFDSPNPNPNPNPNLFSSSTLFPDPTSLFGGPIVFSSTTFDLQNPGNFSTLLEPSVSAASPFNAFDFLQGYLQNMRARGSNVQIVMENHPTVQGFRLPPNLGDYFLGPGLEDLIQQLAENDPNRYGTPPASKQAINGLPNVVITAEVVNSDSDSCAVCMNELEVGSQAKQMPCKHLFHTYCILPWLDLHNSCPVCRYELPTDDPDYEHRRANQGRGISSGVAGGLDSGVMQGGLQGGHSVERRFRISLPWPFSAFTSSGGDNDGGAGNNDGDDRNSDSSSGAQQSGSHGSGPMDLD